MSVSERKVFQLVILAKEANQALLVTARCGIVQPEPSSSRFTLPRNPVLGGGQVQWGESHGS
jgi:hypothetical protein